jgi:hypothetical protein
MSAIVEAPTRVASPAVVVQRAIRVCLRRLLRASCAKGVVVACLLLGAAASQAQSRSPRVATERPVCWADPTGRIVLASGGAVRQRLRHVLDHGLPPGVAPNRGLQWMQYVDGRLLDFVLSGSLDPKYVTARRRPGDLGAAAVCGKDGGGVEFELRLLPPSARSSTSPEGWIQAGASRLFWSVVDSVLVGTSPLAPSADPVATVHRLRDLERALRSRAETPAILLLLRDTAELRTVFPLRWRDNQVREHTFIAPGGPSVGFVAVAGRQTSLHELVHIALSGRGRRAEDSLSGPLSYFFEEALARAIGGSRGAQFDAIPRSVALDTNALALLTVQHAESTVAAVRSGPHADVLRDVVAGVYRVLLRHCREIPVGVLEMSEDQQFGHFLSLANSKLAIAPLDFLMSSTKELSLPWPTLIADLEQPKTATCLSRNPAP